MTNHDRSSSHRDEAFLRACRSVVARNDPTPPEVIAGALAALSWRTVDAELAELSLSQREPCISEPLARS